MPIEVPIASMHTEVLHSLGAAMVVFYAIMLLWVHGYTYYSGNNLIWMSPIDVCRVTSELSLELPAPDYRSTTHITMHARTCTPTPAPPTPTLTPTCVAAICSSLEGFSLKMSLSLSVLHRALLSALHLKLTAGLTFCCLLAPF